MAKRTISSIRASSMGDSLKNGTKIVRPIIAVVLSILFVKTAWELLA